MSHVLHIDKTSAK